MKGGRAAVERGNLKFKLLAQIVAELDTWFDFELGPTVWVADHLGGERHLILVRVDPVAADKPCGKRWLVLQPNRMQHSSVSTRLSIEGF
mgnify:FL=1